MGQFLSYTVEVLDDDHYGSHRLADFARLPVAVRAAKLALGDRRVTLAVVRARDGAMVYTADREHSSA
jgi:hypothetical protein